MGCWTNTKPQKIFVNIINVLLILVGIGLIVGASVAADSLGGGGMLAILIVAGFVGIVIGSVGIYATLKEIIWLIYAYDVVLLLVTLTGLVVSIVFFVEAVTTRGGGDTAAAGIVMVVIITCSTFGGCLLLLLAIIIGFKLARNLSRSAADKSLEDPKFSTDKSLENPEKKIPTATS